MFNIAESYKDNIALDSNKNIQNGLETIEDEISSDIDYLLRNQIDKLYTHDKFKSNGYCTDIISPKILYPGNRRLIKGPDYIKFLLSLYPCKNELDHLDRIILRPRHVEINETELLSLYLRREKILIIYLHRPHCYPVSESLYNEFSFFLPLRLMNFGSSEMVKSERKKSKRNCNVIPPLWYIMSIISSSHENRIDKFFIKMNEKKGENFTEILDKISLFYSRIGY